MIEARLAAFLALDIWAYPAGHIEHVRETPLRMVRPARSRPSVKLASNLKPLSPRQAPHASLTGRRDKGCE
jgi:hypothetical protein